jgi:flagellar biosynthesis/type III secretory pathway protein FliH
MKVISYVDYRQMFTAERYVECKNDFYISISEDELARLLVIEYEFNNYKKRDAEYYTQVAHQHADMHYEQGVKDTQKDYADAFQKGRKEGYLAGRLEQVRQEKIGRKIP